MVNTIDNINATVIIFFITFFPPYGLLPSSQDYLIYYLFLYLLFYQIFLFLLFLQNFF